MKALNFKLTNLAVLATFGTIVSACAPTSPSNPGETEKMARKTESLITEETFEEAYQQASQLSAQDPSNVRAKFWKAVLAPGMELRGVYSRIAPLATRNPERAREYFEAIAQMKRTHGPKFVAFFLNGPGDIKTERDAQELVARVVARIDELRETMKSLRNSELEIDNIPNARAVRLNAADFAALEQIVGGYQVYLSIMNSYDLSGSINVGDHSQGRSGQEVINLLLANPSFGKLRDGRAYAVLPQLAKDAVLATRSAIALQAELCPAGSETPSNRPGHLFENGLCVKTSSALEATLKTVELVASTNLARIVVGEDNKEYVVSAPKFLASPISDVRSLVPTAYDRCGQAVAIADPTIGGLFPRGEIASDLQETSRKSCEY